jgi:hypothetical protein
MEADVDKGKAEDTVTRESEDEMSEEELDGVFGGSITVRKAGGTSPPEYNF